MYRTRITTQTNVTTGQSHDLVFSPGKCAMAARLGVLFTARTGTTQSTLTFTPLWKASGSTYVESTSIASVTCVTSATGIMYAVNVYETDSPVLPDGVRCTLATVGCGTVSYQIHGLFNMRSM